LSGRHTASGHAETRPATTRGRHRRTAPVGTVRPRAGMPRAGRVALVLSTVVSAAGGLLAGPALAAGEAPAASQQSTEGNAVARKAHAEAAVPGTPCSVSARACVDLEEQQAWLIEDGKVVRGPMTIASGGEGRETPVGHSFRVYRKDVDHVSGESKTVDGKPSPMPYSTFFGDGGIAFHAGDPARSSAGCIRMKTADAKAAFAHLRRGDKVQVVNGSQERAHRGSVKG
jgi:hypothetical protein